MPTLSRWSPWILLLAGVLVYANSLSNPFVFDDRSAILANESVRKIWPEPSVAHGRATDGRPLVRLSFALNYALSDYEVRAYRAVNISLHVLCALTLWGLLRRTMRALARPRGDGVALVAALLWLVHPLNSECMNYIAQRSEIMVALCYLVALYAAVRSVGGRAVWQGVAVLACLGGAFCKATIATAPIVIVLYDRIFCYESWRAQRAARWRLYTGLSASWLVLLAINAHRPRGDSAGWGLGLAMGDYALAQVPVVAAYLKRVVWPEPLVLDYGVPHATSLSVVWPQALILALLLGLAIYALRRNPPLGFAAILPFVLLAPTSSIVPILTEVGAERRMYLPLMPLLALAAALADRGLSRARLVRWAPVLAGVVVLVLGWATMRRNAQYGSAVSIWRHAVEATPNNPRAHNNYGVALAGLDSMQQAMGHWRRAVVLDADFADAQHNLATAHRRAGEPDSAVVHFRRALEQKPTRAASHAGLCAALLQMRRPAEALPSCERAAMLQPDQIAHRVQWSQALRLTGDEAAAEDLLQGALLLDAGHPDATYELGFLYHGQRRFSEAEELYRRALAGREDHFEAHYNLASLLEERGDSAGAALHHEQARRLDARLWRQVREGGPGLPPGNAVGP